MSRYVRAGTTICLVILVASCSHTPRNAAMRTAEGANTARTANPAAVVFPGQPKAGATSTFWQHWGDGKAELSAYRTATMRYGKERQGETVLIYVTEPMDRRTWIKDDQGKVPDSRRVQVLKLNHMLKFQTGIYPYSVMTSVFAPVDHYARERFAPAKITLSAQEWCGHVYRQLRVGERGFFSQTRSYFSREGDSENLVETTKDALYEDALLIQLRELDGSFNGGEDWSGQLVPSLWSTRKGHIGPHSWPATIARSKAVRDGLAVTRFVISRAGKTKTIDIERAAPHRVLGWETSQGEHATLLKTVRLPYWKLNDSGDEAYREQLGLTP